MFSLDYCCLGLSCGPFPVGVWFDCVGFVVSCFGGLCWFFLSYCGFTCFDFGSCFDFCVCWLLGLLGCGFWIVVFIDGCPDMHWLCLCWVCLFVWC